MKIIHMEGGLGNQLAAYAEYIAVKESNPSEQIFIDTYVYDIKEAHSTISMWNGYELENIFGIHLRDVKSLFNKGQIDEQISFLRSSRFWENNWNYTDVFLEMMHSYGIDVHAALGTSNSNAKTFGGGL